MSDPLDLLLGSYVRLASAKDSRGLHIMILSPGRRLEPKYVKGVLEGMAAMFYTGSVHLGDENAEENNAQNLALVADYYSKLLNWTRLNERRETTMSADG